MKGELVAVECCHPDCHTRICIVGDPGAGARGAPVFSKLKAHRRQTGQRQRLTETLHRLSRVKTGDLYYSKSATLLTPAPAGPRWRSVNLYMSLLFETTKEALIENICVLPDLIPDEHLVQPVQAAILVGGLQDGKRLTRQRKVEDALVGRNVLHPARARDDAGAHL